MKYGHWLSGPKYTHIYLYVDQSTGKRERKKIKVCIHGVQKDYKLRVNFVPNSIECHGRHIVIFTLIC